MSIPGLGQIPTQPSASSTNTVVLGPGHEWRFQAPHGGRVAVKLLSGTAEKDGTELAPGNTYTFSGTRTKLLSWQRCEIEIEGQTDEARVVDFGQSAAGANISANAALNLHAQLNEMRTTAARDGTEGPRVLVTGPSGVGKTTLSRTLAAYATRQGYQPLVFNADPEDGILSLPGTLSTAVFATVMDIEAVGGGWGSTPTSGPSSVPVKLPLVHYYGRQTPVEEPDFYKMLTSKLAGAASGRLSGDEEVRKSGIIVDSMGIEAHKSRQGVDILAHIVEEVSINVVVVVGSTSLESELSNRFATERTSLGEPIHVVHIEKSDGVTWQDEAFHQHGREQVIKEYFFGDTRRTLSPQIQQVDFNSVVIYRVSPYGQGVEREEPSLEMQHWTLAVMNASVRDTPDTVRAASVLGFLYVSDVDEDRRKIKLLAPVSGRLGDRPLIWGVWPEPYINLLG